jgi:hypothetical protein
MGPLVMHIYIYTWSSKLRQPLPLVRAEAPGSKVYSGQAHSLIRSGHDPGRVGGVNVRCTDHLQSDLVWNIVFKEFTRNL